MFWCAKCRQSRPLDEQVFRGNTAICRPDVNSYASIVQRWSKDKKLKEWFTGMTDLERCEWYRKQQANGWGVKRKFDTITYNERHFCG